MSQADSLLYLANLYQNSTALESSIISKEKWDTAQNTVNELSAVVSLPINSNNVVASSYLLGIVSNAFAASDLAGKLSKGQATTKDILNFSLGIEGTLASAGILIGGGVAATAASPLLTAAFVIGVVGVAINSGALDNIFEGVTNFLSDPDVVDSVHRAFEKSGNFNVNYAPELNITSEFIDGLHMSSNSVSELLNAFGNKSQYEIDKIGDGYKIAQDHELYVGFGNKWTSSGDDRSQLVTAVHDSIYANAGYKSSGSLSQVQMMVERIQAQFANDKYFYVKSVESPDLQTYILIAPQRSYHRPQHQQLSH